MKSKQQKMIDYAFLYGFFILLGLFFLAFAFRQYGAYPY
jgi:hypothetical protein